MRHTWRTLSRPLLGLSTLLLAVPAFCSTIVAITGDQSAFEGGDASDWTAQGWTQAGTYTNVTIQATVFRAVIGNPPGNGFAFLEEQVGGHAVELDSTDFVFPKQQSHVTLFSGLSLGPGTYYLAIYGEGFWTAEFSPVIASAAGVSAVTDSLFSDDGGHTFADTHNAIYQEFRVTGRAPATNGVPEPSSGSLICEALLLGGFVASRRFIRIRIV